MGGGDRCAVYMCNNDRRYKEKLVIRKHVQELKWHACPPKWRTLWSKLLHRKDFKITNNTKICSNHFVLGRPYGQHPHPCLYMKGYDDEESYMDDVEIPVSSHIQTEHEDTECMRTRRGQIKRKSCESTASERSSKMSCAGAVDHSYTVKLESQDTTVHKNKEMNSTVTGTSNVLVELPVPHDMSLSCSSKNLQEEQKSCQDDLEQPDTCMCVKCDMCKMEWKKLEEERDMWKNEWRNLQEEKDSFEQEYDRLKQIVEAGAADQPLEMLTNTYDIIKLKHSDRLMFLHTGLPSHACFMWIFNKVKSKLSHLPNSEEEQSDRAKTFQKRKTKKTWLKEHLSRENELLVTLMKLKLCLDEKFIAYLFGVSSSLISTIFSTWLPILSHELVSLIHWPTSEELRMQTPDCFRQYQQLVGIIDCIEVPMQRPSLEKSNNHMYLCKGQLTKKILVACTPAGAVSFISKAARNVSDKEIVKRSGFLVKCKPGDTVLAERDLNIQELLFQRSVKLVIPPLLWNKKPFSESDSKTTKQIADSRIHIERVLGQIKDFNIMNMELPVDIFDMLDHIVTVIAALVNLQPPVVPLHCK